MTRAEILSKYSGIRLNVNNDIMVTFAAVLAYAGLTAADLTTWESVGALLCNAVRNPYCLFLVLSSVWNAVNDPTTKGVADSERARKYDMPSE